MSTERTALFILDVFTSRSILNFVCKLLLCCTIAVAIFTIVRSFINKTTDIKLLSNMKKVLVSMDFTAQTNLFTMVKCAIV